MYAYVVHDFYGCDSGCCGHRAYLVDADGNQVAHSAFAFDHPYGTPTDEYAIEFCRNEWPGVDVHLDECQVSDQ